MRAEAAGRVIRGIISHVKHGDGLHIGRSTQFGDANVAFKSGGLDAAMTEENF